MASGTGVAVAVVREFAELSVLPEPFEGTTFRTMVVAALELLAVLSYARGEPIPIDRLSLVSFAGSAGDASVISVSKSTLRAGEETLSLYTLLSATKGKVRNQLTRLGLFTSLALPPSPSEPSLFALFALLARTSAKNVSGLAGLSVPNSTVS